MLRRDSTAVDSLRGKVADSLLVGGADSLRPKAALPDSLRKGVPAPSDSSALKTAVPEVKEKSGGEQLKEEPPVKEEKSKAKEEEGEKKESGEEENSGTEKTGDQVGGAL